VNTANLQACFVTWSDQTSDREDCEFYQPEYLALERKLAKQDARRLEEVVHFAQRTWTPSRSEQLFSYIDIASVHIRTGDVQAIELPEAEAPSRARKRVQQGDIIVSTVRPERNAVALIKAELDGAICSTGFAVLSPRMGVDPYSLYAFLKSPYFIAQAVRRSTASMYPAVAEESLRDVFVPRQIFDEAEDLSKAVRAAFQERERFLARLQEVSALVERLVSRTV
jgi:type I restriction enzyme S subunit